MLLGMLKALVVNFNGQAGRLNQTLPRTSSGPLLLQRRSHPSHHNICDRCRYCRCCITTFDPLVLALSFHTLFRQPKRQIRFLGSSACVEDIVHIFVHHIRWSDCAWQRLQNLGAIAKDVDRERLVEFDIFQVIFLIKVLDPRWRNVGCHRRGRG